VTSATPSLVAITFAGALRDQLEHFVLPRGQVRLRRRLRLSFGRRPEEVEANRAAIRVHGSNRRHREQLPALGCPDQDPARRNGPSLAREPSR